MSSFDGLAKGHAITSRIKQDPTQALASCVYKINESVSTFQHLVNTLGTPNDTPQHRVKLLYTRFFIAQLVNDTSAILKQASDTTCQDAGSLQIAGLAIDFESILREFQKAQRVAFEKEVQYDPHVPSEEPDRDSDKNLEKHTGGIPSPSIPSSSNNQRVISSSSPSSGSGVTMDKVNDGIENSRMAIQQAKPQLDKAVKTQKSTSSLTCSYW
ncbi:hypothetical protein MKW94_017627 [Papaver nudicaule]|uniref:Syntaxin N-terminal domain-containing protein n=1 Tax=Papaver nudicaule TaxID=74823 RepID=A0AA41S5X9_PAPNU|nr:hypothetical protein [Papaver nudicaule]